MQLPVFAETDLALSQDKLAQLSRALGNTGVADPVQRAIQEATETVASYTRAYDLPMDRWRRLMRPLAIYALYAAVGEMPEAVKDAAKIARDELQAIKDHEFRDLTPAISPVQPLTSPPGLWGSKPKLETR